MIVVLEVVSGSQIGKRITIRGDQIFTFGRTNLADEMFPDDVMMSGKHFQIENNGQFSFISDLGSRNGTKVNDGFIKKLDLKDGHTIQAGRTRFSVQIEGGARNPYETIQGGSGLGSPSFPIEESNPPHASPEESPGHGTHRAGDSGSRPGVETPLDLPPLPDTPPQSSIDPSFPGTGPASGPILAGINPNLIGDAPPPAYGGPVGSGAPPSFPTQPPGPPASGKVPPMGGNDGPQFKFFNRPTTADPAPFNPTGPGPGIGSGLGSGPGVPPPPLGKVPLGEFSSEPTGGGSAPGPAAPSNHPAPPISSNGIDDLPAMGPPGGGLPSGPPASPPIPPQSVPQQPGRGVSGLPGSGFGQVKNPNLIGWDDEPESSPASDASGPWSGSPISGGSAPIDSPPGPYSPPPNNDQSAGRSDWRNPPLSAAPPDPVGLPAVASDPQGPLPATPTQDAPTESKPSPTPKLAIRFGQEITQSNLHVCRTFSLDETTGEVSPSRLLQALAKQSKLVLAIHFMRAGIEIPDNLTGGVPIRSDLPAEVAKSAGPILLQPEEIPAFAEVVDQAWDQDALIGFLTRDPAAAIRHLQQVIFFDDKLEASPKNKKALFCAVYSPNLFSSFLSTRDEAAVKRLMGDSIDAVITEVSDLPGNWQLLGLTDWTERLTKLGLKQQQPSEISGPPA